MIKVPLALVRELRAKLRDYPETNYLYEAEESKDQPLARCLWEGLERFNLLAPILDQWTFQTVPRPAIRYVIDFALVAVLIEVSIWMVRNQFQYQAGNTSVRLYDKYQAYLQISGMLDAKVEKNAAQYKIQKNIDGAWGESVTEMYDSWADYDGAYVTVTV